MSLAPSTRVGPYEVTSQIGVGGMGEVYRAIDTNLKRTVAIKVLPEAVAGDPNRLARFQREAEVLAKLNHPNIAQIYGLEKSDGTIALVMELVEGPTLADRIAERAIPIDEALRMATQIVEALEAAHAQGIVHRDLKPANIKVRGDGTVKVLDFGLAKALEPLGDANPANVSTSPTITSPAVMTGVGVLLGSAAYMAPEQAKGRTADKRSDMWAFGCVLYELITGSRAFEGDDVSDTLADVLKSEPDWSALPADLPGSIRALVRGCLQKDRGERIGDTSTALFFLRYRDALGTPSVGQPSPSFWRRAVPLVILGVAAGAAAATALVWKPKPLPSTAATRFLIPLPEGQQLVQGRQAVTISPDGTRIVYATDGGLFLRPMSEIDARAIPGSEGAVHPVFSPDGQWLAFWNEGALKRIAVDGGTAVTIFRTDSTGAPGIAWTTNGILFAENRNRSGVMRVSPDGGKPEVLVGVNGSTGLVHGPQLLPDGQTVLFTLAKRTSGVPDDIWSQGQVVAQSLKTGERKILIDGGDDGRFVPTGHLVYLQGGTLFAVPFDPGKLAVTGGPVPLVQSVAIVNSSNGSYGQFAFSSTGSLVYVPGLSGHQDLMLFDRKGNGEVLQLPPRSYAYPRVSPDGRRLAFETIDGQQRNVSIYELSGTTSVRRLTFGGNNRFPIWSADSRHVAFQSDRDGDPALFWQAADGGPAERLTKADAGTAHIPESWSPAADAFLFSVTKGSETSLWTFSMRDRQSTRFDDVTSTNLPPDAAFSPDGRWVAYQVGASGQGEGTTYVQPVPPDGKKYEIARGGRPLWSRDGNELFYIPGAGRLAAVTVKTQPTFVFTNPVDVRRGFGISDPSYPRAYDILGDGRIVGVRAIGQGGSSGIQVVENWFEELRARVPVK